MIIRRFSIRGLHGYKDVTIEFDAKARIVVAENGSGKTTIISALNAILTNRLRRLGSVDFHFMEVEFWDGQIAALPKSILNESSGKAEDIADRLASETGVSSNRILSFVRDEYDGADAISFRTSNFVRHLVVRSPHPTEKVLQSLSNIHESLKEEEASLADVRQIIRKQLKGTSVIFLPTYRRVELPLVRPSGRTSPSGGRLRHHGPFGVDTRFRGMNFGLSDVEERLGELADEVERRSNTEYRLVSARIVNQLLKGRLTKAASEQFPLPALDALELFFSRVSRGGEYFASAEALREFYEMGDVGSEQGTFLRYFLGQLSQVIDQTKAVEEMLRTFVDACNQYLKISSEEKILAYVPESMKVEVHNRWSGTEVELDDLSSGEKQVISLMAKLYLEPEKKIILIDEPELSLSIDWQRRILLDMYRPDNVVQFLAITHSPFVFDNELGPHAASLQVQRHRVAS